MLNTISPDINAIEELEIKHTIIKNNNNTAECEPRMKDAIKRVSSLCDLVNPYYLHEYATIRPTRSLGSCIDSLKASMPVKYDLISDGKGLKNVEFDTEQTNARSTEKCSPVKAICNITDNYKVIEAVKSEYNLSIVSDLFSKCSVSKWRSAPYNLSLLPGEDSVDVHSVKSDLPKFFSASTESLTSSASSQMTIPSDSDLSKDDMLPGARRRRRLHSESDNNEQYSQCSSGDGDGSSSYYSESVEPEVTVNETQPEPESKIVDETVEPTGTDEAPDEEGVEDTPNLDADEDKSNPAYVPRVGRFYMHDQRLDENSTASPEERKNKDTRRWQHDKFNYYDQAPKTTREIIQKYGYNIREKPEKSVSNDAHDQSGSFSGDVSLGEIDECVDTYKSPDYEQTNALDAKSDHSIGDTINQSYDETGNVKQYSATPRYGNRFRRFTAGNHYAPRSPGNRGFQRNNDRRSGHRAYNKEPGFNQRVSDTRNNRVNNYSEHHFDEQNENDRNKYNYAKNIDHDSSKIDEEYTYPGSVRHREKQSEDHQVRVDERGDRRMPKSDFSQVNVPKRYSEYRQKVSSYNNTQSGSYSEYPPESSDKSEISVHDTFDGVGRPPYARHFRANNHTAGDRSYGSQVPVERSEFSSNGCSYTQANNPYQYDHEIRRTSGPGHYTNEHRMFNSGYRYKDSNMYQSEAPHQFSRGRNRFNDGRPLLGRRSQNFSESRDQRDQYVSKEAIQEQYPEINDQLVRNPNSYARPAY